MGLILNKLVIPEWPRRRSSGAAAVSTWRPLRIGAGGYVTAVDIALDGTKVVRTDTYGGHLWDGSKWAQLVTALSLPADDVHVDFDAGIFELVIAPSNTLRLYMLFQGYLYRSDNRGTTWIKTAFARVTDADANGSLKLGGAYIAVDPNNADVVFVGTPSDGLFVTTDAGATWSAVTGMTTSDVRGFVIAFDPSSAVSGGRTQGVFASKDGTGVYYSDDAGATWTLTTSGPTTHRQMRCGGNGRLYLVTGAVERCWVYTGGIAGTWAERTIGGDGNSMAGVAVDPDDPDIVVVINEAGLYFVSTDGLATNGTLVRPRAWASADIPWLANAQNVQPSAAAPFMSVGSAAFDPSQPGRCYVSGGIGVWYTVPIALATPITYTSQSVGIEQLVATQIVSPPGVKPFVLAWDRPLFQIGHPDVFPSTYLPDLSVAILKGSAGDYAAGTPSFAAFIVDWFGYQKGGYTDDGGATYTIFPAQPYPLADGKIGGCLAVSTPSNIIWVGGNNPPVPKYTTDGGSSWGTCSFPGIPTTGETGWLFAQFLNRHILAADRVTANKFYAYNYGPTGFESVAGIWVSTDSGANWTQVFSGAVAVDSGFNARMRAVPGNAGHLFFTSGQSGSPGDANPRSDAYFKRSTDGGVTWTTVTGLLEIYDYGFGKIAPGGTYPCIYVAGWVNGDYGIHQSKDNCATWRRMERWPLNSIDAVRCISGDMNAYGRCYLGWGGSGFAYGDTDDAEIPPIITYLLVEDTPGGAVVTFQTDRGATSRLDYGLTSAYGAFLTGPSTTAHQLTITGQTSSTILHFKITVTGADGNVSATTDRSFMTTDITDPAAPTGLTATAIASSKITLADWTATDDVGVDHYRIYAGGVFVTTVAGPPYTVRNLLANTLYSFTVSAVDAAGNEGAQSSAATATTQNGAVYIQTDAPDPVHLPGFGTSSHTFTGVIVQPGRNIIGIINQNGGFNGGISSVTVNPGGLTAVKKITDQAGEDRASQWLVDIPSGTSVDITVVTPSTFSIVGITAGVLLNVPLTTPHDTGFHDYGFLEGPKLLPLSPNPTPTDTDVNLPTNGVAVELFYTGVGTLQTPIWDDNSVGDSYKRVTGGGISVAVLTGHSYEAGAAMQFSLDAVNGAFDYSECSAVVTTWAP